MTAKRTSRKRTSRKRTSRRIAASLGQNRKRTSRRISAFLGQGRKALLANYTPPRRGFVYEPKNDEMDEETGELTLRGQIRREMVQKLAAEWNQIHAKLESQSSSEEARWGAAEYFAEMTFEYADKKFRDWLQDDNLYQSVTRLRLDDWPADLRAKYQEFEQEFSDQQSKKESDELQRLDVIEELLGELGGRMMRPYEHWNEDEKYMEYAERSRYDDDY